MVTKLLLTGPHVDRALTLLALIATSTNPVERDRYEDKLKRLRTQHPQLHEIRDDDPRLENVIHELRAAFEVDERKGEYSDVEEGRKGYR